MRPYPTTFTLTEDHVKLLRRFYVGWQDCETGAPEINPKRPYGNKDVVGDMSKILGVDLGRDENGDCNEAVKAGLLALHAETEVALQIVLSTGSFKPGDYYRPEDRKYDHSAWIRKTK